MNYICCLLAIAYLGAIALAQDYCNMQSCNGAKHIACGNNFQIGSSCVATATYDNLSSIQADILKSFNDKRNALAGGQIPNHSTANRMATMEWDTEMSNLAGLNAKTCNFAHDSCRNTGKFRGSGQNIGQISWYGGPARTIKELVLSIIDMWWAENKDSNMNYINSYSNPPNNKVIGHFTVMGADKNPRVGCGALRFKKVNNGTTWDVITVTCNLATTNWLNSPIYASGPATSKCTTGRNPSFPNLCSVKEVYAGL